MNEQKKDFTVPVTKDGKVDVDRLRRAVLRFRYPLLHKFIVLFEWTYGIWFIWLGIMWIFIGNKAAENLLITGIAGLIFVVGPIFWFFNKFRNAIEEHKETKKWSEKKYVAICSIFICGYTLVVLFLIYVTWPVVLGPVFQEMVRRLFDF